jgi:hypothetical protein
LKEKMQRLGEKSNPFIDPKGYSDGSRTTVIDLSSAEREIHRRDAETLRMRREKRRKSRSAK